MRQASGDDGNTAITKNYMKETSQIVITDDFGQSIYKESKHLKQSTSTVFTQTNSIEGNNSNCMPIVAMDSKAISLSSVVSSGCAGHQQVSTSSTNLCPCELTNFIF